MRKIYLFILLFCIQMSLVAQEAVIEAKVHLTEPGKLSATLREQGYSLGSVTKLIVTGKFDQRDFSSMKMQMGSLHYVDISGTDVTEIPAEAMRDKSGLTHFFAPKSVSKIGGSAFYNCYQLQQIPFDPMSIDSIGSSAFSSCGNMKGDLIFSDKLFYIGSDAFHYSGITSVDMSASERITHLGSGVFNNCSSLKKVNLAPSIISLSWGTFSSCSSLTEIDLSVCKNLSNIDSDVFNSCTGLRKVILPESLRYLSTPFSGCSNLRDIVVKASTVPSIQEMTFGSVNWDEAKLFVPVGTKGEYEKAQHWNLFYDIFEIGLMVKHNAGGQVKYKSGVISNNQVVFHDALETRFDIIPNDGYVIKSVRFLGNEQTPSDRFIVPAGTENGVLDIEFALRPFAIQVQIQGEGTVRADELNVTNGMTVMADSSEMKRFIIHPAPGYILNELTFNGQTNIVQQDSVYVTPVIHGDATLNIQFASESEAGKAHKLHFTIGENGRVDYMNTPLLPQTTISIKEGDAPVFTFHPESTYRVASVRLNGEELVSQLHENQLTLPALTQTSQLEILFDVDPVVSVHLSAAGTLESMLLPHQYPIVKDLRLTGELNEYDFSFIRHQLAVLQKLDIEQTQVSYQSIPHFLPYEALREKSTLKTILLPITLDSI
ncbi:MAG: leucine-rich repeat domain-containing protein [Bacteroidales bacterium]